MLQEKSDPSTASLIVMLCIFMIPFASALASSPTETAQKIAMFPGTWMCSGLGDCAFSYACAVDLAGEAYFCAMIGGGGRVENN